MFWEVPDTFNQPHAVFNFKIHTFNEWLTSSRGTRVAVVERAPQAGLKWDSGGLPSTLRWLLSCAYYCSAVFPPPSLQLSFHKVMVKHSLLSWQLSSFHLIHKISTSTQQLKKYFIKLLSNVKLFLSVDAGCLIPLVHIFLCFKCFLPCMFYFSQYEILASGFRN